MNFHFMLHQSSTTHTITDAELLGRQAGRQAFQNDGDGNHKQAGEAYLIACQKYPQILPEEGEALFRLHFCQAYLWG